ncbi:hypothetical protein ACFWZ2_01235 [Streptomyces sp. NPDC059002]|uniref:hypothetical protein n=1 Tax=Streptomyces sp. NPDC059002 TaxID=3346690 RepID=UPI0036808D63
MYGLLRANDPAGFDAWRDRLGRDGGDGGLQSAYDAFLDRQIAHVDDLFVPDTRYVPVGELRDTTADQVRASFTATTSSTPTCTSNGAPERPRYTCTGRITANLGAAGNPDAVFKDMSETLDYFLLERAAGRGRRQQPGRHELLVRQGGHLVQRPRGHRRLQLRGPAQGLSRHGLRGRRR